MTYIVNENCIKCKFTDCVEVCPVDCFYEGENMLVIHPDECIDCGVCEPECPVDAIKPDTEPGLEKWLELNRAVFREVAQYYVEERGCPPDADKYRDEKENSRNTSRRNQGPGTKLERFCQALTPPPFAPDLNGTPRRRLVGGRRLRLRRPMQPLQNA